MAGKISKLSKKSYTVIQVVPHLVAGGGEELAAKLHARCQSEGFNSLLVGLAGERAVDNTGSICLGCKSPYSVTAWTRLLWRVENLSRNHPVLLHCHMFPSYLAGSIIKCFLYDNIIATFTEHSVHNRRRDIRLAKILDYFVYLITDSVFAISNAVKRSLCSYMNICRSKTRLIYNGIELDKFQIIKSKKREGKIYTSFKLVSVGRVNKVKNYMFVLQCLKHLKGYSWHWTLLGDGPLLDAMRMEVEAAGLSDRVRLMGYVNNVPSYLQESDIFLHFPKWEGFGLVVAQAMASRCLVITHDIPGLNEVCRPEYHEGVFVEFENTDDAVRKIELVFNNFSNYGGCLDRAQQSSKRFDIKRMENEYVAMYHMLLQYH